LLEPELLEPESTGDADCPAVIWIRMISWACGTMTVTCSDTDTISAANVGIITLSETTAGRLRPSNSSSSGR